jgi:ribosomal protein S18 acetylase RimI-like enzyme
VPRFVTCGMASSPTFRTAFRAATIADAPAVVALWRQAAAEPTHTDNVESLRRLIERDPSALILAELEVEVQVELQDGPGGQEGGERRLVGSVIAGWDGWRGSIYRLAVVPDQRRRGLGRQLVRRAEGRLAAVGAVRCQAIVVETDDHAVAFWRASGWEQQSERLRFVMGQRTPSKKIGGNQRNLSPT